MMGIILMFFQDGESIQKTEQHNKVLSYNILAYLSKLGILESRSDTNPMIF